MSARALLNVIETTVLDSLDPDERALTRWSFRDPAGFLADQQEQTKAALLAAGGEIG